MYKFPWQVTSTTRRAAISHDKLVKHWSIHSNHAKDTVQYTTQRGVCTKAMPALSFHFQTNNHMLWYRCLHYPVFTNSMFSNMYLCWKNKCMYVLESAFGWVCMYSIKPNVKHRKPQKGVPPSMEMDSSKEKTLGKFYQKLDSQMDLYSLW